jgi:DNA-binding NarL/FixJ family response regulator
MIRVLISAHSPRTKERLVNLLRPHAQIETIEESRQENSPISKPVSDWQADVVLAAIDHPEEATEVVERFDGETPLILLTAEDSAGYTDPFWLGVRAVLPDDLTQSRLVAAIEAVAAGLGVFLPDEMHRPAPASSGKAPVPDLVEPLTPREIEILRAMADGLGNKEIAMRFGISENTVKFHVGSVMGKLGAGSRTEAVMLGIRHGIVFI